MDKEALGALAQRMISATREYVGKSEAAINEKLSSEIAERFDNLPVTLDGRDGEQGPAGEQGLQGDPGPQGEQGELGPQGVSGEIGAQGADGDRGEAGPQGEAGLQGLIGAQGERGEAGEKGADGVQGPQGITTPEHVVAALVASHVQAEVGKLPMAKDGVDGRDAADLIVLQSINEKQSYRRGTWASHNGGLIQSVRATDPLEGRDLTNAGWTVIVEGIAAHMVNQTSARSFEVACQLTSGVTTISSFTVPAMIYKDIWKDGNEYEHGDVVTWAGSSWHCQTDTTDKPGTGDTWRLMVKRGSDGKNGDKPPAAHKVVRTK